MTSKVPPFVLLLFGIGVLLLILGVKQDIQNMPEPYRPVGVTGYWQGGFGLQLGDDDDSRLILGLDLSLTQTESSGDITGRIAVATSTMYLSFDITQGKAENGIVTFEAAGPAGVLPSSPILTFHFSGTETTDGSLERSGVYLVSDKTYDFTWWATRGESEGMHIGRNH